ncbi:UDP-galactopyranose mutase [Sulfurimonas sp. HSL-1716]|uniref:UDP-galactopyranose mutase n=1 Tax=Hydrocurvibacter sulfurireducens TaxID=3131937 RepID=UPI0031F7B36A
MYDVIIVGAGFAGSVLAHKLATRQNKKVLIIDKRPHIGGNCFDSIDEHGILIHNYGPHLFHTDSQKVWTFLSQFTSWHNYHHKVEGFIDGHYVPIPFNLNTLHKLFPRFMAESIEKNLVETYGYGKKVTILELQKTADKDLRFIADFIYEKIFLHYSAKQWGKKIEELDPAVSARVPVAISKDDRYFHDPFQAMPQEGYAKLFENMLSHENIEIRLNTEFKDILRIEGENFIFEDRLLEGEVVFTGMIDELFDFRFGTLPYRSIELVFENHETDSFQNATTTNYPNDYDYTRITEFKKMYDAKHESTTIAKEYPQEFVYGKNTPYYPIFTDENQKRYEEYKKYAQSFKNLTLVGRLAEYKYYDMDDIVLRALEVFEERFADA